MPVLQYRIRHLPEFDTAGRRGTSAGAVMVDFPINPRKLALVNVDLQNVFVEGTPISPSDGPEVVARVNKLAAACRTAGILVIHTAHVTRPDGSNVGVMGELIPPVGGGMIAKGSFTAAFHKDLMIETLTPDPRALPTPLTMAGGR